MNRILLWAFVLFSFAAVQAQNIEHQIVASQYGEFKVPSVGTGFSFPPASCQVSGGGKNFAAFTTGVPVKIVDENPAAVEVVTPTAVFINSCAVSLAAQYNHTDFYLTSGTGGLQEAIINGQVHGTNNTVILDQEWYSLIQPRSASTVIGSVTGNTSLGLVDVTTTPYTWYAWNGSAYAATGGGGGGGDVNSVFGRTGTVVAASGDYTVSQVTGAAPLASPTFTGIPAGPTASGGTNTTQFATTAFVQTALGAYAPLAAATFTGTVAAPNFIDSGLTAGLLSICPNGTGGAFVNSGCLATNLSGTPTLPNGTSGATQTTGDTSVKLATDAFVAAAVSAGAAGSLPLTGGTLSGAFAAPQINNTMYPYLCGGSSAPSWCSGSTPDAWYRAACSQLPSTGGFISLHNLAGNWAATSRGCSTPTKQVITVADPTTTITVTETDGDAPIVLDNYSMFIGPGKGQCEFGRGFVLGASANVNAIIENAHTDGTQEAMVVQGACLQGNISATVAQALILSQRIYANTTIEGNVVLECNGACLKILNGSSIEVYNNWLNSSASALFGGSALIIQGSGLGTGCNVGPVDVHAGQIEHAYGGVPDVLVEGDGAGAQACGIHLYDFGIERNNVSGSTIGIKIQDCLNCSVEHVFPSGTAGGTDYINVSETASGRTQNIDLKNIYASGAWTNVINDTTPSPPVTQPMSASSYPQITEYVAQPGYDGTGGGGGITFPAGILYGNGTTSAPSVATGAQVATAIAGQTATPGVLNSVVYANGVNGAGIGVAQTAWSSSTAYPQCTAVSYSSNDYIAVAANTNVTPGTNTADWWQVPNANTPTNGDCGFYVAASKVNGTSGAQLIIPPGNINSSIGWMEPTVTTPGNPAVAILGAGKHASMVTQTSSISTAVITQPQSGVAYAFANVDWEGFTVNANFNAPADMNVYGAQQFKIAHVTLENPADGSDHYIEFGESGGANHTLGWTYEADLEDIDTLNGHAPGSGAAVTVSVSGGSLSFTVTAGGSNYSSTAAYNQLVLAGAGANADVPCTSRGTDTITVSGGAVTAITSTASGCTGPIYASVFGGNRVTYGFKFNDASDSKMIASLTPSEANTGVFMSNITSQMALYKTHPIATYTGIVNEGNNSFYATQVDSIYRYGFDFEGAEYIASVFGSDFEYNTNVGPTDYHFGTITGSPSTAPYQININGDICGNAPPSGGYYHFISKNGGGNAYIPSFVHPSEITSCDSLSSNTAQYNYTGTFTSSADMRAQGQVWSYGGQMNVNSTNASLNEYDMNGTPYLAQTISANQYIYGSSPGDIDVIYNGSHNLNFGISNSPAGMYIDASADVNVANLLKTPAITLTGFTGTTCLEQVSGVVTSTGSACGSGGGTTTNALTLNNGGSGASSGTTFNGSAAVTLSYNTIGAAPLASPTFTGTPAAPTASTGTNTTQLATTAYVMANQASGMTTGGAAIAGSSTTITSSKALAGSGAGLTTGPTSSTSGDVATFTGTAGQVQDSGTALSGLATSGTNSNITSLTGITSVPALSGGATLTTTGSSCGTLGTLTGGKPNLVGQYFGTIVAGAVTTCTLELNFGITASHGYLCLFSDVTTNADSFSFDNFASGTRTTTSCTSLAGTIGSGDTIAFQAIPY